MDEAVNQTEEKTFTQEQLNAIVGERLAKEKTKLESLIAQRELELSQRELLLTAKEKLTQMGLPAQLAHAINLSDAKALDFSLNLIRESTQKAKPVSLKGIEPPSGLSRAGESDISIRQAMGLN